jgi:squalene-associated FAD-dependent desaturase
MSFDAVVVGGGFAGLSAAAALSDAGARVLVLEARPVLGGRASAFTDPATGETVDNGQHLMLGCYHETLAFLARVGASGNVQIQACLEVSFVDEAGRASTLSCPPLPPPLHLLAGLVEWDALGFRDRMSALSLAAPLRRAQRYLRTGKGVLPAWDGETVENWLMRNGQSRRLREMLWAPLALAALNQPAHEAAAPAFLRVLAQMFGPDPRDSAVALPLRPLDAMYAEPARRYIAARGGEVRLSCPARVRVGDGRVAWVEARGERVETAVVIVAVPWFALTDTIAGDIRPLEDTLSASRAVVASPIVTVNLWLDRAVLPAPFVGLPGRTFQWVFDKRQVFGDSASHLSCVASGAAAVVAQSNDALAALAAAELGSALPAARGAQVRRSAVVRERRATFSLAPGQPPRPAAHTAIHGLLLAGDWTDTGLPATIEGAVVSGHRAAHLALGQAESREPKAV